MRLLLFVLLVSLSIFSAHGQIIGNGSLTPIKRNLPPFKKIELGLYARVEITTGNEYTITGEVESNLYEHIQIEVKNGILIIDQINWVEPTKRIRLYINSPDFIELNQSTHDTTVIRDIDQNQIRINAETGRIKITGNAKYLEVECGTAFIDAFQLEVKNAKIKLTKWGQVKANVTDSLESMILGDGKIYLEHKPKFYLPNQNIRLFDDRIVFPEARFIDLKIKNNSSNRHNFYVEGPKQDGSKFSYGFPLMPFQKRDKHWTVGTKVYTVNSLGIKKLVLTIKAEDEGETVNIF